MKQALGNCENKSFENKSVSRLCCFSTFGNITPPSTPFKYTLDKQTCWIFVRVNENSGGEDNSRGIVIIKKENIIAQTFYTNQYKSSKHIK